MSIAVVGAGLAGSIVARFLRNEEYEVTVIDDNDPFSGSKASSNLYIASWLKKFAQPESRRGIEVLETLFKGKINQPFDRGVADAAKVRHIAQEHVLVKPDVLGTVIGQLTECARPSRLTVRMLDNSLEDFIFDEIVYCCGYRGLLLGSSRAPDILVGHCLHIRGDLPPGKSSLSMPLPYRHHKLYQLSPGVIYFANSTTLKKESFDRRAVELKTQLIADAVTAMGRGVEVLEYRVGYRPIIEDKPFGQMLQHKDNVWSVNGGGKNGMVAYANLAAELAQRLLE